MTEAISGLLLPERVVMAQEIVAARERVAAAVTAEFLVRHPDWVTRYGDRARARGIEDGCHHINFLASAIESGAVAAFCDYARWCQRLLGGFGIAPHFLAENLQQIAQHLAAIVAPPVGATIASFTESAVAACLDTSVDSPAPNESPLDSARAVFLQTIFTGRRREALSVAREALRQGHTVAEVYVGLFQQALYEMGRLWESGQITVAQEHMATATVQYVIAQMYSDLPPATQKRGNAIVTGVQGEFHQVGANMVADMLEMDGWSVRFLGTNMPHSGILAAIKDGGIDLLGISATMLFNLSHVRALVEEVRSSLGAAAPRIVVGGGAFRACPEFCSELGVDGPATDVCAAVELCASTVG